MMRALMLTFSSLIGEGGRERRGGGERERERGTIIMSVYHGSCTTYLVAELLLVTVTFAEKSSPMRTLSSRVNSKPSALLDSD